MGLGFLTAVAGCAIAPAVTPSGLPKVTRYASPAQLDWMLARYQALGQTAPATDDQVRDEACLGWERAVFDLQSAQRYPMLLRMSSETTNLTHMYQDLPALAQRHPRPSGCAEAVSGVPVVAPGGPTLVVIPQSAPLSPEQGGPLVAEGTDNPAAGAAPVVVPVPMPVPVPAPTVAAPRPETHAANQRLLLARLRTALGMPIGPRPRSADSAEAGVARSAAGSEIDESALQVLTELAQSDVPPIRLRARFHLLGLCALAVEAADRYLGEPDFGPATGLGLANEKVCGPRLPGETLRQGQSRLLWSLLGAWKAKYPEPMSDLVIALASFAGRDNPVVDGPRVSR